MTKKQAPKWTEADIASIRADMAAGKRDSDIARRLGMLQCTFHARLRVAGIVRDTITMPESMRRGAAVLVAHYETTMDTAEVFARYAEARGMPVTLKIMRSQAHKLRLNRPLSLKTMPVIAQAALAVKRKQSRNAIAEKVRARLAAGETLPTIRASMGFGRGMIATMKRDGLLENRIYRARTAKPKVKPAPAPKPVTARVYTMPVQRPAPPPAMPLPSPASDGKVYATFWAIRAWAEARGFAYDGSNMDQLNKRRAAAGLPLLVQDEAAAA